MPTHDNAPSNELPPLRSNWFHILLCLADGAHHGYGIMQEVLDRTDGKLRLWPATLYGALRRLITEGLIEELEERESAESPDARRRYYRLTEAGSRALGAEITRLEELVQAARAKRGALFQEAES